MKRILFLLSVLAVNNAFSQKWQLLSSIECKSDITCLNVDDQDAIYFGDENGSVTKYNSDVTEELHYLSELQSSTTSINTNNRLKIEVFYQNQQEIHILDRFLRLTRKVSLNEVLNNRFILLIAFNRDNTVWLFDGDNLEITKNHANTFAEILNIPLNLISEISTPKQMLSIDNGLLISDENNYLFYFDRFGSLTWNLKIDEQIKDLFSAKNQLFLLTEKNTISINIETQHQEKIILPKVNTFVRLLSKNDRHFCFSSQKSISSFQLLE